MNQLQATLSHASRTAGSSLAVGSVLSAALLAFLGACNTGNDPVQLGSSAGAPGDLAALSAHPSGWFVVEENKRGAAGGMKIVGLHWGRLVEVQDTWTDLSGETQHSTIFRDFVIGEDIRDGMVVPGVSLALSLATNPITDAITVTVPYQAGTPQFATVVRELERNLTPIDAKSLDPGELPPFSLAPRNCAIVIQFDDLLDASYDTDGLWHDHEGGLLVNPQSGQVNPIAVRVATGYPPVQPFEARVFADPNHGDVADYDGDGVSEFHSTRVVIDCTVSETEAAATSPPLGVNALGLPASITTLQPNVAIRIPTRRETQVGQTLILRNPTNHGLAFGGNGPTDPSSITLDVVRALRSGNPDDVNNGFLFDEEPPVLIGSITVSLQDDDPGDTLPGVESLGDGRFRIRQMRFEPLSCAVTLKFGADVLEQSGVRMIVEEAQQDGALVSQLVVRVVSPVGGIVTLGAAQLLTAFDPQNDVPECFVRFSPNPSDPPNTGVSKDARVIVRFSEPMDPAHLGPFDTMTLTRKPIDDTSLTNFDYVVGRAVPSADLREFSFVPVLPLDRSQGVPAGIYHFALAGGNDGPTDLAGNHLELDSFRVDFGLDTTEPVSVNGGVVLRFSSPNELIFNQQDADEAFPEVRSGQLLYDLQNEVIRPRPVSRFSAAADRDKAVPSIMTPFPPGVQTPLSPLGSKLQTLWRYVDVGFSLTDETNINIDIEGLAWAPVGGALVSDSYDEFSIRLAHSFRLPDELLDPNSGFPLYPQSGLIKTYAQNYLDPQHDPGTIVHPRERGYTVTPADVFVAESGTFMVHFPMNQGIPTSQFLYYTWRDTALLAKGGPNSSGAVQAIELFATTGSAAGSGNPYPSGQVPTVGLPLLMEFRCYPDDTALGLNAFDISLAVNSSARPNFRAFSTGGFDTNNNPVIKDPDTEDEADGGFNPGSSPPGATTPGIDNSFYIGQMDLVTRVSRVHTIWFDTTFASPTYAVPVVEPTPDLQPAGTQVILAFRGATQMSITGSGNDTILTNAGQLDVYGDPKSGAGTPTYLNGDATWRDTIQAIDGARYFQARITFISNTETNLTAELSSLAFAYSD